MSTKFNLILVVLLPVYLNGFAQEVTVTPPSPEASSVFKFSDVPVSLYSGLANISMPLAEIDLKNLKIPITVDYFSRGIKVNEVSSRVGSGWALSYGGIISRQIRDMADDGANGCLSIANYEQIFNDANSRASLYNSIVNTGHDLVPDQFYCNFLNENLKFIMDPSDKGVLLQHYADVKIETVWNVDKIEGFVVTDAKGNKYYYGLSKDHTKSAKDYDVIINNYSFSYQFGLTALGVPEDDRIENTWHLMEIETVNNEKVVFEYELEMSSMYSRSYDKKANSDIIAFFSEKQSYQCQIKRISYPEGEIDFTPENTERQDLVGSHSLMKVSSFDYNHNLINEKLFHYNYQTAPDDNNQLNYLKTVEPESQKRLFLTSIEERGAGGEALPPTQFFYNDLPLPNRFSNAQDLWGYYNGKNNGQFLSFYDYGTHSDRSVDTIKSKAGLLKKMTYPEGGSINITYSANKGKAPAFIGDIIYPISITKTIVPINGGFLKNYRYYHEEQFPKYYSKELNIGANKVGGVTFSFRMPYEESSQHYSAFLDGGPESIFLSTAGDEVLLDIPPGDYTLRVVPGPGFDPSDFTNLFIADLEWKEERSDTTGGVGDGIIYAGGSRVERIEYSDIGNIVTKTKTFRYLDDGGECSGKVLGLPDFYYVQKSYIIDGISVPAINQYGAVPGSPLSTYQQNGIGYSFVSEFEKSNDTSLGKTSYEFTNFDDSGDYYVFPYHAPIDNEWLRGKALSTRFYAMSSGVYQLKKEITNVYKYADQSSVGVFQRPFLSQGQAYVHEVVARNFYLPLIQFTENTSDNSLGYNVYYQTGGSFDIYHTTEKEYENGFFTSKETFYNYAYDYHYQPVQVTSLNSDNKSHISSFIYPTEYSPGTDFIDMLVSNHCIDYPIENLKLLQEGTTVKIIGGGITKYDINHLGSVHEKMILESSVGINSSEFKFSNRMLGSIPPNGQSASFAPDFRYHPETIVSNYDGFNNILTINKGGLKNFSFKWAYNSKYPIVTVDNSSSDEYYEQNFEEYNGASAGLAHTGNKYYDGVFQIEFALQNTRDYLYSYWYLETGVWKYSGELIYNGPMSLSRAQGIDDLRIYPKGAQMTTYTYKPLVGMTSMTDPKGMTTYYEYDGFQRLGSVKDSDGNILKKYVYHYQDQ